MSIDYAAHLEAVKILRQEYFDAIRAIGAELKGLLAAGEITSREDFDNRVHQAVDGSYWVIYTHAAQQVIFVTHNDDAYMAEYPSEGLVSDGAIDWAAIAYAAMARDLCEHLDAIGVNVRDPIHGD